MSRDREPDWEAEGLLDGLGEEARESRIRLLRDLRSDGATLTELRRAVAEDRLALLPVERILGGDEKLLTGHQVAARLDVGLERIVRTRRALGLPVPPPDEPAYTEDETRGLEVGLGLERVGFTEEARLEVARVIGRSMAQVAEAMRAVTVATFQAPGSTERDVSLRYADAARSVAPVVGDVLQGALTAHLREQIRQDVVAATDIGSGRVAGAAQVAVAFADLVDFTRLGEELATEDVGEVAKRLEELSEGVTGGSVRVVKMIGDAAMLVSRDPRELVEAVLSLVEAVEAEGEGFPPLRAGVAFGEAIGRGGDWYGRPVNLASRLTAMARPASVLGSEPLRDIAGDEAFTWSFAGKRRLKGIRDETPLYRIRRRTAEGVK